MENFIFKQKRKMDGVKQKEKVKELQDKYIPFLEQLIRKLKNANAEKSREAQLNKMQSLYTLLKDKPKTLTADILEKTEQVLGNLYQKLGPGNSYERSRAIEDKGKDDPQSSKALALRPNMDVELSNPRNVNLDVVKQKLMHVNDSSKVIDLDAPGGQAIESVLKQKASAIIGDKGRPVDPRLERRAVTSEIRFSVNRISTVISTRTDKTFFNPRHDPIPPEGYPIPLASFQTGQSVDLYCRRTQDKTFHQQRYPSATVREISNTSISTISRPALPALPAPPVNADMNILNSPPLSSDDIQSLMKETNNDANAPAEQSSSATHTVEDRLAPKYTSHPSHPRGSFEKSSSHLPIDSSGNITVSLDDPRLKKPIPPRSDPRRDPRLMRPEPSQTVVSNYDNSRKAIEGPNRKAIEAPNRWAIEAPTRMSTGGPNRMAIEGPNRMAIGGPNRKITEGPNRKAIESRKTVETKPIQYETNNPAPPKKSFNPMERRSELDDDYMDPVMDAMEASNKFQKLKAIESVPRENRSGDSSVPSMKSQFDKMYRKNDFSHDYDKRVKNINQGIKDFKIPKKMLPKTDEGENKDTATEKGKEQVSTTKEKKREKSVEKKLKEKNVVDSEGKLSEGKTKEKSGSSSDSEKAEKGGATQKTTRRRIKIIDTDSGSEISDVDSATLLSRRVATVTKKKKPEKTTVKAKKVADEDKPITKKKSLKKKIRAVSEEKSEGEMSNYTNRSKASTPEPVSSTQDHPESETSGKLDADNIANHTANTEGEKAKDTITKEWLEGVLSNMLNPNTMTKDKLMDIMKNVLDEKKFEQVKSIVESDDTQTEEKDDPPKEEKSEDVTEKADSAPEIAVPESTVASESAAPQPKPRRKPGKKKTTELDKLNEDIRTMFISEGVLTATGRRMCTALRKETVCLAENPETTTSGSPKKTNEEVDPAHPQPGPSKKGRKRKVTNETREASIPKDDDSNDLAKKLNANRMVKIQLEKLKDSELPQNVSNKKGKKKDNDEASVSDSPPPIKRRMRRRASIWFRNPPKKKTKNTRTASSGNETDQSLFESVEPLPKKRPGPKSKTQLQPAPAKTASAPMDIDVGIIKKEGTKESFAIKNIDPTLTAINHKNCKICGLSAKQIVMHYVKEHSLNEVFCSRLPRNISDFLKCHEKGMLYAESYNMKLHYAGSKVFGHCIFCREEMYEQPNRWITHFTKHTGEYEYLCTCNFKTWSQKVMRTHVKKCEERGSYVFNEIVLGEENYIRAFMCGDCNFVQLLEENVRSHIITEHTTCPKVHQVILLNFADESVKENHPTFLEMYKHNSLSIAENQEGGVFKSTNEKDNEPTTSKSILDDLSKSIQFSGIANKLNERFGEKSKVANENVVIKTEDTASEELLLSDTTHTEDTASSTEMTNANHDNPIDYDDDEWEDIESDSDESVMSQSSRPGQSKKLTKLVQKIGAKGSTKRKSDATLDVNSPKKTKTELASPTSNPDKSAVVCKTELSECYKVENFHYQIVDGETQYHCLMSKCLFVSSVVELFIDHLVRVHEDDTWSGYCDLCKDDKFPVSRSVMTEFHHLVNDHPWKKPDDPPAALPPPEIPPEVLPQSILPEIKEEIEEVKPAIRLRRLSGDKLSAQMDSFKIPTTPTTLRSVTIRRVSKSPDLSPAAPTSASPPATVSPLTSVVTSGPVAQSSPLALTPRSIVITRATSAESLPASTTQTRVIPASMLFSTASPIQSMKTLMLSIPTPKTVNTTNAISPMLNAFRQPAKISLRRSTISTDILPGVVARVDNVNELKPWIKQPCTKVQHAVMKMLTKEVLCAPFKCMGTECWFCTESEVEMVTHLKCHDQISEEQSERTTITDTTSWLECSYCDYMAGSRNDLMLHLKWEHLHCEYLCPKCFFRACNANYVARHLQVYHKTNISAWHLKSDYKNTNTANPVSCVKENVQLLLCKYCNLKFLNYVHFLSHLEEHATDTFECGFCSSMIPMEILKKHMFCHLIGDFECIYCEYATNLKSSLAQHMCDKHNNRPLLYYNREEPQEHVDKFKLSTFDDFCQFRVTTEYITKDTLPMNINKFPIGIAVVKSTTSAHTSGPSSTVVAPNQNSLPLVISNVVSLHGQPQPTTPPSSSLVIKDVCTLSRDTPSSPLAPAAGSSTLAQSPIGAIKIPAIASPKIPSLVLEGVTVSKEEFENQSFSFSTALAQNIADWVSKSGIPLTELLKCSEARCDFQGKFKGDFMEHIDRSHPNSLLKCPQCINVFWHSSGSLWSHLETHGQKRYFCFMCDFMGKNEQQTVMHCTKIAHKWIGYTDVVISSSIPGGVHLICPKNTSPRKIEQFKADFVRSIQKLPQEVPSTDTPMDRQDGDAYGPDDIDKLPSKPVVKNVSCKLCGYKTQIVKNLVRHFDAHRLAEYVPNLDPVNPVPCLSSNEKNFDKMTNLACSSNMDSRTKNVTEPAYIVQQKRFVCGVGYCSYITIDDTMLKYHLSTLHSIETSYKCPHCQLELLKGTFAVDPIIMHYRLHGEKLFMCDKCQHMSETTQNVEKHIKTAHSGSGNIYILRDESKNEASTAVAADPAPPVRTTAAPEEPPPKKWICNECNHTTYLKTDMAAHVLAEHATKYQYQCGYCSVGHLARSYVIDHINSRHGDKIIIREAYAAIKPGMKMVETAVDEVSFWRRDESGAKTIRGIPCESSEILPRNTEEEEEEYASEDDYPEQMSSVAATSKEMAKEKLDGEDFVPPVMQKIERIIQCNLCGKTTKSALTMQVVHYPDCHPGQPVSTKVIEKVSSIADLKTSEVAKVEEAPITPTGYRVSCFHCRTHLDTVSDFKKHYVEQHGEKSTENCPPCLFSFVKTMFCGLCQEMCGTYDEVAQHLLSVHKTDSVIAKCSKDSMVCGACDYDAGDDQNLLRHAKLRHTNNKFKPLVSPTTLDDMLKIRAYPMKRCTACKELVCDIDGRQSEEHLRTKHSASVMATFVAIRNPTYICGRCQKEFDSETSAYTHILTHTKSFKCSMCANFFAQYEVALEHRKVMHSGDINVIQFTWPVDAILESQMVFPNGLVLSLEELQKTKYRFDQSKFKMTRNEVVRKLKITPSDLL